jgi:hypothetical protein
MKWEEVLYILLFKDEPLLKVGHSVHVANRIISLGRLNRFDLNHSYLVHSGMNGLFIPALEREIIRRFQTFQQDPRESLCWKKKWGHSEVFNSSILSEILKLIEDRAKKARHTRLVITQGIDRDKLKLETKLKMQEADNEPCWDWPLYDELKAWCKAERGRQRQLAGTLGVSEALVSNWLARRKTPILRHWLALHSLLQG